MKVKCTELWIIIYLINLLKISNNDFDDELQGELSKGQF